MTNSLKGKLPNLIIMLFSIILFFVIPYTVTDLGTEKFGPRFLPYLSTVLIFSLSILSLFEKNIINDEEDTKANEIGLQGYLRILGVLGAMIAWFLLLSTLGFIVNTIIFTIIVMYIIGSRNIFHLIIMPLILTTVIYYIFNELLNVILPTGILF